MCVRVCLRERVCVCYVCVCTSRSPPAGSHLADGLAVAAVVQVAALVHANLNTHRHTHTDIHTQTLIMMWCEVKMVGNTGPSKDKEIDTHIHTHGERGTHTHTHTLKHTHTDLNTPTHT